MHPSVCSERRRQDTLEERMPRRLTPLARRYAWTAFVVALLHSSVAGATSPTIQQCVTTNEDGQDRRRQGRLREAEALFDFCSTSDCPTPLRQDCTERLAQIRAAIPTLVFLTADARANNI